MNWLFELPTPLIIGMIFAVEMGIMALVIYGLQKLGINTIGGLTTTAWLQGVKNAFSTWLIMGVVLGALALILAVVFRQSIENGFFISVGVISIALYIGFILTWAYRGQKAGNMLLHIMTFPNRGLSFVLGILITLAGLWGARNFVLSNIEYSWLISIAISFSAGTYFVIMSLSHIQVHENGIVAYIDLIRWSKIESFKWVDDQGKLCTLKLRYKGKLPAFLRNGAIPIPIEKKEKLESILVLYLSEATSMQNRA